MLDFSGYNLSRRAKVVMIRAIMRPKRVGTLLTSACSAQDRLGQLVCSPTMVQDKPEGWSCLAFSELNVCRHRPKEHSALIAR